MTTLLKDFTPRLYQETIFGTCALKNCLVVLPTGLGKTGIALMLIAQRLTLHPGTKAVVVAPTKPLAEQHASTFRKHLNILPEQIMVLTGETSPEERTEQWQSLRVAICTPQGLENDLLSNRINFTNTSLFVFDEAHRAVGDYSYVFLAKQYARQAKLPRILGLTASPGSEIEHIADVCQNLLIEDVEVRTTKDSDVAPYVQDVQIDWVKVDLGKDLAPIRKLLQSCTEARGLALKQAGANTSTLPNRKELLALQRELQANISQKKDPNLFRQLSLLAECIKLQHALELVETQGVASLLIYLTKLREEGLMGSTKAARSIAGDTQFKEAFILTEQLNSRSIEHPKLARLAQIITDALKTEGTKIILFAQYRDTGVRIQQELASVSGAKPVIFVGHAKKGTTGLSQKEQAAVIKNFREGTHNILIATSVAEEGLDIPAVDTVIFYEPIPSAIRYIQRRGRTGRQEKGKVIILMTKGTRDEAFHWASLRKEKHMHTLLTTLRKNLRDADNPHPHLQSLTPHTAASHMSNHPSHGQTTVQQYTKVLIYADHREQGSRTTRELSELGAEIRLEALNTADYVVSSRVGIELKKTDDFAASIIDGRLQEQAKQLKQNFAKPILIIEGPHDISTIKNIHPNAVRGMTATLAVAYGISLLRTTDEKDTAALIHTIAKQEQDLDPTTFSPHTSKKPMSLREAQEYLISSIPGIGPSLSKQLLKHFRTVRAVLTADESDLLSIEGVGEKKARAIIDVGTREY